MRTFTAIDKFIIPSFCNVPYFTHIWEQLIKGHL